MAFSMHPARLSPDELLAECQVRADRRGGPGGQHRNKVQTAVVIVHKSTGISAEANERRSQVDNRRVALFRLRLLLAIEHRSTQESGEEMASPSPLWCSRMHGNRIAVASAHDDYPAILAELLDALHCWAYDLAAVSTYFSATSSLLMRLLRSHPPALVAVNDQRIQYGLHKLT